MTIDILRVGNDLTYGGLVLSNAEEFFIIPLPEESENLSKLSPQVLDTRNGLFEDIIRQTDLMETEICGHDGRKIIVRKSQRQLDQIITWKVFKRDSYTCRYCGNNNTPLTYDHVLLWEDNGPNTVENGVTACKKCNKTRGNTKYNEWLKSDYYLRVSNGLSLSVKNVNNQLVEDLRLGKIKPTKHKRSR